MVAPDRKLRVVDGIPPAEGSQQSEASLQLDQHESGSFCRPVGPSSYANTGIGRLCDTCHQAARQM